MFAKFVIVRNLPTLDTFDLARRLCVNSAILGKEVKTRGCREGRLRSVRLDL